MSKRREIVIQQSESQYKEEDTIGLFDTSNFAENDKVIKELLEKNTILNNEVRTLKREHEIQSVRLCEVVEQKKKAEDDKAMAEVDKRQIATRLDERTSDIQRLTDNQLDMVNQLLLANQELGRKDLEINQLKHDNDHLKHELRTEKEINERMNKPNEAEKYFEELFRSPRRSGDRAGLGLNEQSSTKEGESSKSEEQKTAKPKDKRPTCHHCGKLGHTTNICRRKHGKSDSNPSSMDIKHMNVDLEPTIHPPHPSFKVTVSTVINMGSKHLNADLDQDGHLMGEKKLVTKCNNYNWDYNTWYNCHYCGKYGHIGANYMKTHFRGKSKS